MKRALFFFSLLVLTAAFVSSGFFRWDVTLCGDANVDRDKVLEIEQDRLQYAGFFHGDFDFGNDSLSSSAVVVHFRLRDTLRFNRERLNRLLTMEGRLRICRTIPAKTLLSCIQKTDSAYYTDVLDMRIDNLAMGDGSLFTSPRDTMRLFTMLHVPLLDGYAYPKALSDYESSSVLGYSKGEDTAMVNAILHLPASLQAFPSYVKLCWEQVPSDLVYQRNGSRKWFALIAVNADSSGVFSPGKVSVSGRQPIDIPQQVLDIRVSPGQFGNWKLMTAGGQELVALVDGNVLMRKTFTVPVGDGTFTLDGISSEELPLYRALLSSEPLPQPLKICSETKLTH